VVPQRDCDVPVAYESTMVSVISRRTQSSTPCVVVGLVVHVWCECGVCGFMCMCTYRCYSCTQMRDLKKTMPLDIVYI